MNEPSTDSLTHRAWWGMLAPRPSANCPPLSRAFSALIQFPLLLVGLCLAAGMLIVAPLLAILVAGTNWLHRPDPPP